MTQNQLDSRSLKWIKEGRGVGSGKDYKPWLTVRDLSSSGRSHRVWGFQTKRIHHFLSDLELSAFLLFNWNPAVSDIREKYPLRFEDTIEIAKDAGIRHPSIRGKNKVMYTDFLLDLNTPECQRMAIQVQPLSEVYKPRSPCGNERVSGINAFQLSIIFLLGNSKGIKNGHFKGCIDYCLEY